MARLGKLGKADELELTGQVAGQAVASAPPLEPEAPAEAPDEGPQEAPDIIDPIGGECIDPHDIDGLIDLYEKLKEQKDRVYACLMTIRRTLAAQTEGDAKTRRIRGKRRQAKITMPSDVWDNSVLKEAWESFPQHRDGFLRIEKIAPKVREVKKMVNTSGPADFECFRDMVCNANRGPTGTPSLTIEK